MSHQIKLAGIDEILQINTYLIRVHALAGAKCFSDLLGVGGLYKLAYCDLTAVKCSLMVKKGRTPSENVDNTIYSGILRHVPSLPSALHVVTGR